MVDEVEITNVGGKRGVASEATLERLVDAMDELGKKFNVNTKELQNKLNQASRSINDHEEAIENETEARENNTSALEKSGRYLGDLSSSLYGLSKAVVGTTLGAVQGLSTQLIRGSNELSDFAAEIPLIGNQLSMLTRVLDNSYQALNNMAMQGGAFGYELDNLRSNAARAGLSLQEFSGFVNSNSDQLAAFGGTVTQGARRTSQMVEALGDQREQLLGMGLSFEEINEQLQMYQFINRAGARQESRTRQEQAAAAASLTKNMLTLSKLTGKDVQQMQEQLAQEQQSMAFQRELAMMPDEQRDRINQAMADIQQTGGQAAVEAFKAEFLGLPPVTRQAQLWTATQAENAEVMKSMVEDAKNRDLTEEERSARRANNMADIIENTLKSAGDMEAVIKASAAGVEGVPAEIGEIFNQNAELAGKYIGESGEFLRDQFEKDFDRGVFDNISDPELTGLAGFKDNLREVRSSLTDNLINPLANVVGSSLTNFNGLLKDFTENGGLSRFMEMVGNKLDEFETWFEGWIERFTQDPKKALEELFQEHIGPFFARAVGKVGEYIGKGLVSGITNLFTSPAVLAAMTAGIAGLFATGRLKGIGGKMAGAAAGAPGAAKSGTKGMMKGAGNLAKGAGRRFAPAALALGAFDLVNILGNDELSGEEKAQQSAGTVGGMAGAVGGAAAGAAVGSAVPLVGTALGGLIGGGLGYFGGSKIMEGLVGGLFGGDEDDIKDNTAGNAQSRRSARNENQTDSNNQVSEQTRQTLEQSDIDLEKVARLSPEEIGKLERVADLSNGLSSISDAMINLSRIEGEMPFETLALSINDFKKLDPEAFNKVFLVANSRLGEVFSTLDESVSVLQASGFKDKVLSELGSDSPFEKFISNINDFNKVDPAATDKMYLVANSGLGTIFAQLNEGMSTLQAGGFKDLVLSELGSESPFEKLISNINDFNQINPNAIDKMYLVANSGLNSIFDELNSGMSALQSGGFKQTINDVLGGSSPFERLIAGIADFNKVDPNAIDKMYLVANSGLNSIFDELNSGMSALQSGGFKETVLEALGSKSPFEKLISNINDFNQVDTNALDNLSILSNSGLGTIFSQLDNGMDVLSSGGLKDKIFSALGSKSPFEKLVSNLNQFTDLQPAAISKIETAAKSIEKLSTIESSLDTNPVNQYTDAIQSLTEALGELNSEISDNNVNFGTINENTQNQIQNSDQTNNADQLNRLNIVMTDILNVLLESNNVSKKQLRSTRAITGDLHRAI